ncbi:MAG: NAD-dependent deacetylase [Planctomycetota bacterium]
MRGVDFDPALIERLRRASRVLVLTGAGVSAESGIPTFRGDGGLWREFRAEDLATPEAFARDPHLVWTWYEERRALCRAAQPGPAHEAIARLEQGLPEFLLVTQNVDGLHRRAGSKRMLEIHGCLLEGRCTQTGRTFLLDDPPLDLPVRSPHADAPARPHVVWFGEAYDARLLEQALAFEADVCLAVGTSAAVGVPASLAARTPFLVEVNPDETLLSRHADACLRGPAGALLGPLADLWLA